MLTCIVYSQEVITIRITNMFIYYFILITAFNLITSLLFVCSVFFLRILHSEHLVPTVTGSQ